jgi:arabinofuranosyltransferase
MRLVPASPNTVTPADVRSDPPPGAGRIRDLVERLRAIVSVRVNVAAAAAACWLLVVVVQQAWVADDGFISLRYAWNLAHGHGLVFNTSERVQGFTNPLWTLLVAGLVRLRMLPYHAAIVLGIASTLVAAVVLAGVGRRPWFGLAPLVLALSPGFVQFSTGGLENSLAHALLLAFLLALLRGSRWAWPIAGLVVVNRLDHALLVAPALLAALPLSSPGKAIRPAIAAALPPVAWLVFSFVYYGFALPNTLYAKLNTDIPRLNVWLQGEAYLVDAVARDPVMAAGILCGVLVPWLTPAPRAVRGASIGIVAYVAYVVSVGGDFMAMRFLTAPFAVSALIVTDAFARHLDPKRDALAWAAIVAIVIVQTNAAAPPDPKTDCGIPVSGVVNERSCYAEFTALSQNMRIKKYETHDYWKLGTTARDEHKRIVTGGAMGMQGLAAGPDVHLVDAYALTDAFLARIRFRPGVDWRQGHMPHPMPNGYLESLEAGSAKMDGPCEIALWNHIQVAARDPVLSGRRLWFLLTHRAPICPG